MVEKTPSEKRMIYYGEPAREVLEEVIGNIGDDMSLSSRFKWPCYALRLKLSGIKSEDNKIILPNVCWEKICKTGGSTAQLPVDQIEINNLVKELIELKVCFGDFEQIIKMLENKKGGRQ